MKPIRDALTEIIDSQDSLKVIMSNLETLKPVLSGYKAPSIQAYLEKACNAKTKTALKKQVSCLMIELDNLLVSAEPVEAEEIEEDQDGKEVESTNELEAIALKIKTELNNAQKSSMIIGKLLKRANERVKETGGNQQDFLKWAKDNCGILKAQAYKLMKVFETFGEGSDFENVAMRVLYTLTYQTDDVVEKAREFAKAGTLDMNTLDVILEKPVVPPKSPKQPEGPEGDRVKTSFELKLEKKIEELERENFIMKDQDKVDEKDQNKALAESRSHIDNLNKTIKMLSEKLEQYEKDNTKSVQKMPFLPQFKSTNPCTVLGLEPEYAEDKVAVNRAFRELAKIYTAISCKEGAECISKARESLLK